MKKSVVTAKFFEPSPLSIDAVTISPDTQLCAVGRSQGIVEIFVNSGNTWHTRNLLYTSTIKASTRCLVWIPKSNPCDDSAYDYDLIVSGLSGRIACYNVDTGKMLWESTSYGGAVWSASYDAGKLYLTCDDGTLKIFEKDEYSEIGEFYMKKSLDGGHANLAGHGIKSKKDSKKDLESGGASSSSAGEKPAFRAISHCKFSEDYIFVGDSDSRIVRWDRSGNGSYHASAKMKLEKHNHKATTVWSLVKLNDKHIASGDSLGRICIWDAEKCVQLQDFTSHQSDVMSLAVFKNILTSGGTDAKMCQFRYEPESSNWIFGGASFADSHDIYTLAARPDGKGVVSGGTDSSLYVHMFSEDKSKFLKPEQLSPFSHLKTMSSPHTDYKALETNLVVTNKRNKVDIWLVELANHEGFREAMEGSNVEDMFVQSEEDDEHETTEDPNKDLSNAAQHFCRHKEILEKIQIPQSKAPAPPTKILEIQLDDDTKHIVSSAISETGDLVAISNTVSTRLFRLNIENLSLRAVKEFQSKQGLKKISKNTCESIVLGTKYAVFAYQKNMNIVDLENMEVVHEFTLQNPVHTLCQRAEWLAISDIKGNTMTYNLDLLREHCKVPQIGQLITAMEFLKNGKELALVSNTHVVSVFDMDERKILQELRLHNQYSGVKRGERICGIIPLERNSLLCYGHEFMATVSTKNVEDQAAEGSKKKRRKLSKDQGAKGKEQDATDSNDKEGSKTTTEICVNRRLKYLLDMFSLGVGQPLMGLQMPERKHKASLPQQFARKAYGQS